MNLIILEPSDIAATGDARLTGVRAEHLRRVLKATPGQEVRIGLLDGPVGVGTVVGGVVNASSERTDAGEASVTLRCRFEPSAPPRAAVDILLALPRPKVMRRLWAQIGALGVGRIMLTNAERVERNYFDTHVLTPDCYRPLLIEGLQQARDTRLPVVSIHRQLKVLLEDELDGLAASAVRLVAHPGVDTTIAEAVRAHRRSNDGANDSSDDGSHGGMRVLLAVGPEGGWNAFELDLLAAHGFTRVALGARTLRVDTACVALLALTHAAMRESSVR